MRKIRTYMLTHLGVLKIINGITRKNEVVDNLATKKSVNRKGYSKKTVLGGSGEER